MARRRRRRQVDVPADARPRPLWRGVRIARGTLLFVSLLYVTVYIPLTLMIYLEPWYFANCHWHPRCERLGMENVEVAVQELTRFFRHQGELVTRWTPKEQFHLLEVRNIYDGMFLALFPALAMLIWAFDRRLVRRFAWANIAIVCTCVVVLPFFRDFWNEVFHPLLFDNELWRTDPRDISWYVTPRVFFLHSTIALIIVISAINLALALGLRERRPRAE
jgi:uncharacterized membrane protein